MKPKVGKLIKRKKEKDRKRREKELHGGKKNAASDTKVKLVTQPLLGI